MGKSSGKSDVDLDRWIRWLTIPFTKKRNKTEHNFMQNLE